ncbi:hypothetical protein ACOME3_008033 [Neoechinorhynchus agilis]
MIPSSISSRPPFVTVQNYDFRYFVCLPNFSASMTPLFPFSGFAAVTVFFYCKVVHGFILFDDKEIGLLLSYHNISSVSSDFFGSKRQVRVVMCLGSHCTFLQSPPNAKGDPAATFESSQSHCSSILPRLMNYYGKLQI